MGVQAGALLLRDMTLHVGALLAHRAARLLPLVQDLMTLPPDQGVAGLVERVLIGPVDRDDLEVPADTTKGRSWVSTSDFSSTRSVIEESPPAARARTVHALVLLRPVRPG